MPLLHGTEPAASPSSSVTGAAALTTTITSPPSDAAAVTGTAVAVVGRQVPREMGRIRVGGAGRPVPIATAPEFIPVSGGRSPSLVLARAPRSPFGRRLDVAMDLRFSAERESDPHARKRPQERSIKKQAGEALATVEHVHARRHGTRRTPLQEAAAATASASDDPVASPPRARLKRHSDPVTISRTRPPRRRRTAREDPVGGAMENPATLVPIDELQRLTHKMSPTMTSTAKGYHLHELLQTPVATSIPPVRDDASPIRAAGRGYHLHEVFESSASPPQAATLHNADEVPDAPTPGTASVIVPWRQVDESIDQMYDDPAIDIVQMQLLNAHRRGRKRKDIERERLLAAASELQKAKRQYASRHDELQRRKEQIAKMSEEIRLRNKETITRRGNTTSNAVQTPVRRRPHSVEPQVRPRKPPVPRLSGSRGKRRPTPIKNALRLDDDPIQSNADSAKLNILDTSKQTGGQVDISSSILMGDSDAEVPDSQVMPTPVRPHKRTPHESRKRTTRSRALWHVEQPKVAEETKQRRAVAREYMLLQKRERLLAEAKEKEQLRAHEMKRRQELEKLERARKQELDRLERRKHKMRSRDGVVAKRVKSSAAKYQTGNDAHSPKQLRESAPEADDHDDAENQASLGNQGSNNDDSADPVRFFKLATAATKPHASPIQPSVAPDTKLGPIDGDADPRLAKLLQLQEKAKALAAKLNSLPRNVRDIDSVGDVLGGVERPVVVVDGQNMEFASHPSSCAYDSASESSEESDDDLTSPPASLSDESIEHREAPNDSDSDCNGAQGSEFQDNDVSSYIAQQYRPTVVESEFDLRLIGVQNVHIKLTDENADDSSNNNAGGRNHGVNDVCVSLSSDASDDGTQFFPHVRLLEETADAIGLQSSLLNKPRRPATDATFHVLNPISTKNENTDHPNDYDRPTLFVDSSAPNSNVRPNCFNSTRKDVDEDLIRLIRESDDNLSVIDREAKRLFRLQQQRFRQRQHAAARQHETKMISKLMDNRSPSSKTDTPRENESSKGIHNSDIVSVDCQESSLLSHTLEEIIDAVKNGHVDSVDDANTCTPPIEQETKTDNIATHFNEAEVTSSASAGHVAFWNDTIAAQEMADGNDNMKRKLGPSLRVEMDASELIDQRERKIMEDWGPSVRILSPRTLAKQMIAAVEYHEAIHEAHVQLAVLERNHAIEQVQQDSLALAQSFKEEVEQSHINNQLLVEHQALEKKFDDDLRLVTQQLEMIHENRRAEEDAEVTRLKNTLRQAQLRELAVQTDGPQCKDAGTVATDGQDKATYTDAIKSDAGVQYEMLPEAIECGQGMPTSTHSDKVISGQPTKNKTGTVEKSGEFDEYDNEQFDEASVNVAPVNVAVEDMIDDSSISNDLNAVSDAADGVKSAVESVVSEYSDDVRQVIDSDEVIEHEYHTAVDEHSSADYGRGQVAKSGGSIDAEDRDGNPSEPNYDDDFDGASSGAVDETGSSVNSGRVGVEASAHSTSSVDDDAEYNSVGKLSLKACPVDSGEVYSSMCSGKTAPSPSNHNVVRQSKAKGMKDYSQNPKEVKVDLVPPDVIDAFTQQLQLRKQCEEQVLNLRLTAIKTKLQHDIDILDTKIANIESERFLNTNDTNTLQKLKIRRESLHMAYISEEAAIQSQKAASVARYYQDLLAFQSCTGSIPSQAMNIIESTQVSSADSHQQQMTVIRSKSVSDRPSSKHDDVVDVSADFSKEGLVQQPVPNHDNVNDAKEDRSIFEDKSMFPAASVVSTDADNSDIYADDYDDESDSVTTSEDMKSTPKKSEATEQVGDIGDEEKSIYESETAHAASQASDYSVPEDGVNLNIDNGNEACDDDVDDYNDDDFAQSSEPDILLRQRKDVGSSGNSNGDEAFADVEDEICPHPATKQSDETSEVEYSDEVFEESSTVREGETANLEEGQHQSTLDDSSTTKLLLVEVAKVNEQAAALQVARTDTVKQQGKLNKKKGRALELLQAKEKMIAEETEAYRLAEEGRLVDEMARLALQVDVGNETEKAKSIVDVQLRQEFETLKRAHPEIDFNRQVAEAPNSGTVVSSSDKQNQAPQSTRISSEDQTTVSRNGGRHDKDEDYSDSFEQGESKTSDDDPYHPDTEEIGDEVGQSSIADDDTACVASDIEDTNDDAERPQKNSVTVHYDDNYDSESFEEDKAADSIKDEQLIRSQSVVENIRSIDIACTQYEDDFDNELSLCVGASEVAVVAPDCTSEVAMVVNYGPSSSPVCVASNKSEKCDGAVVDENIAQQEMTSGDSLNSKLTAALYPAASHQLDGSQSEDSITESIEAQQSRMATLKGKIDQRKQELIAVQRQLKIEKKKESLREEERRLWSEMENLEIQLGTYQRTLTIAKQRSRLESLQFEAQHSQTFGDVLDDNLMSEYDFIEFVEELRPPIQTKDLEIQVQMRENDGHTNNSDSNGTVGGDLLLAYDYVEAVESVLCLNVNATAAEVPRTNQPSSTATTGVQTNENISAHRTDPIGEVLIPSTDTSVAALIVRSCTDVSNTSLDVLASYDFVEVADRLENAIVVAPDDDLSEYDHIEWAEPIQTMGSADAHASDSDYPLHDELCVDDENFSSRMSNQPFDTNDHASTKDEEAMPAEDLHMTPVGDGNDSCIDGGDNVFAYQTSIDATTLVKASTDDNLRVDELEHSSIVATQYDYAEADRVTDLIFDDVLHETVGAALTSTTRLKVANSSSNISAVAVNAGLDLSVACTRHRYGCNHNEQSGGLSSKDMAMAVMPASAVSEDHGKVNSLLYDDGVDTQAQELFDAMLVDAIRRHVGYSQRSAQLTDPQSTFGHQPQVDSNDLRSELGELAPILRCISFTETQAFVDAAAAMRLGSSPAIIDAVTESAADSLLALQGDVVFRSESLAGKRELFEERLRQEMDRIREVRERSSDEAARWIRKVQERENGEVDSDDTELLNTLHRTSISELASRSQDTSAGRYGASTSAVHPLGMSTTPRASRRTMAAPPSSRSTSQLFASEREELTRRLTELLLVDIMGAESSRLAKRYVS